MAFVALLAIYAAVIVRSALLSGARRRNVIAADPAEQSALAASRFTIPVSVITSLEAERPIAIDVLRSLLALDYPQFEIIAVTDSSRGGALLELLKREFALAPRQMFYRRSLPGHDVHAIYGGPRDERLLVVDHVSSQPAGAWNCAVNLARYRYIGVVAPDRTVARDALLKAMTPANTDPASVVAILGHLGAPQAAAAVAATAGGDTRSAASGLLEGFDRLQRLRDEVSGVTAPADLGVTTVSPEAFGLWRRDAVIEAGGFAPAKAGEGLDLALRVQQATRQRNADCRILLMPDAGQCRPSETLRSSIARQARCYHAMLESAWRSRGQLAASTGRVSAVSAVAWHVLPGLLEGWLVVALPLSIVFGVLGWRLALAAAITVSLAKGVVTNAALLVQADADGGTGGGTGRANPVREICLGALEFAVHRPLAAAAAALGSYEFVTGRR